MLSYYRTSWIYSQRGKVHPLIQLPGFLINHGSMARNLGGWESRTGNHSSREKRQGLDSWMLWYHRASSLPSFKTGTCPTLPVILSPPKACRRARCSLITLIRRVPLCLSTRCWGELKGGGAGKGGQEAGLQHQKQWVLSGRCDKYHVSNALPLELI